MPKLHTESELEYKRRVIDIKSESFCAAKWYNATIWLGSGMTTSCHHPLPHLVDIDNVRVNPKELHNTKLKKLDREKMQRGERPAGCEYCWKIEDIGRDNISDRVYKTIIYSDEDLETAFNTPATEDINLQTLEIAFDRTCQFACSYCNPAFSSTWARDINRNGPYVNLISDGRNHFTHSHDKNQLYNYGEDNPYVDAFFAWWESDLHKTLQELRITGGEPLMSAHTWKLLDWFRDHRGATNTRLAINSNLGADVDIDRFLDSITGLEVELYTSNESILKHAEYIRDGLDWRQWELNIRRLAESGKISGLHIMCTINALCLESLTEFLDWCVKLKQEYNRKCPTFSLNILRFPSFQSPLVLSDEIRSERGQRLQQWYNRHKDNPLLHQMELNQVQRLIDYLDVVKTPHADTFEMPKLHNDFKNFYQQYDQRRNKDFANTFPELKDWFNKL